MRKIYHLAVEATLDVIGGKWKPVILCHLGSGPMRTGELCRAIPNVSQRVLTRQLRELEADHIIQRKVFRQVPPRVEYSLTDEGKSLRDILIAMSDWGEQRVKKAQQAGEDIEISNHNRNGFEKM